METDEKILPVTLSAEAYSGTVILLKDKKDFIEMVQERKIEKILWVRTIIDIHHNALEKEEVEQDKGNFALIIVDGIGWAVLVDGFSDYSEMTTGRSLGFEKGDEYRGSLEIGAKDAEEYHAFSMSGFKSLELYREINNPKYPVLYSEWQVAYSQLKPEADLPEPEDLYEFMKEDVIGQGGFILSDSTMVKDAYSKGFWKKEDYEDALEMGLSSSDDYFLALEFHISDKKELDILKENGIEKPANWNKFCEFQAEIKDAGFTDALGYYITQVFSQKPYGESYSVSQFQNLILSQVVKVHSLRSGFYFDFASEMEPAEAQAVLLHHPDIRDMFYPEGNAYISECQYDDREREAAVLDLSNIVLYENNGGVERKADINFLNKVVAKLRDLGVKKIVGIADATFGSDVGKAGIKIAKEILDTFQIVKPAEPADLYILDYAEKHPCMIVTNDHFADWTNDRHPWRMENVPRLLLPFTFEDQEVYFEEKEAELVYKMKQASDS